MGEPFRYPLGIAGRLNAAARGGASADSVRRLYHALADQARVDPAGYVVSEAGLLAAGRQLLAEPGTAALAALEVAVERSPPSYRAHEALGEGYESHGSKDRAEAEYRAP